MKKQQEIWDNFSPEYYQGLVNTMPQRTTAGMKSKEDVAHWHNISVYPIALVINSISVIIYNKCLCLTSTFNL
nr:unnamed protein product [Callosobruchus analis]